VVSQKVYLQCLKRPFLYAPLEDSNEPESSLKYPVSNELWTEISSMDQHDLYDRSEVGLGWRLEVEATMRTRCYTVPNHTRFCEKKNKSSQGLRKDNYMEELWKLGDDLTESFDNSLLEVQEDYDIIPEWTGSDSEQAVTPAQMETDSPVEGQSSSDL